MSCPRFPRLPFPNPGDTRRALYLPDNPTTLLQLAPLKGPALSAFMGSRGFPSARLVALDLKDNADTEPPLVAAWTLSGGEAGWPPIKGIGAIPGLKQCPWSRVPQHSGKRVAERETMPKCHLIRYGLPAGRRRSGKGSQAKEWAWEVFEG